MALYMRNDDGMCVLACELSTPVTRKELLRYEGKWWQPLQPVYAEVTYVPGDFVLLAPPYSRFRKRNAFLFQHVLIGY